MHDYTPQVLAELRDMLREEISKIGEQVGLLRLELQKQRLTERARRLQAELGFRGDLGWQCLRCGQDFRSLRDAENHLFLSSHCRKCGRALPEATSGAASALCEFCSSDFMQARLKKRLGKRCAVCGKPGTLKEHIASLAAHNEAEVSS